MLIACLYNHNLINAATAVQATRALMSLHWTRRVTCNMIQGLIYYAMMGSGHSAIYTLVQFGNGIELEAVGFQLEPYLWRPCGVTWESSRTVVVIKLRQTSTLTASGRYQANEAISHWLPNKS